MPPFRLCDVLLLPRILGVLGVVSVAGRRLSLDRLVRLLERSPRAAAIGDVDRLVRLTRGVLRRTHRRAFCHPRSLILFHVLSGWGYPVALHYGVRKASGRLEGHAWIDLAGEPLGEPRDPHALYHIVRSYPSTPRRYPYEVACP